MSTPITTRTPICNRPTTSFSLEPISISLRLCKPTTLIKGHNASVAFSKDLYKLIYDEQRPHINGSTSADLESGTFCRSVVELFHFKRELVYRTNCTDYDFENLNALSAQYSCNVVKELCVEPTTATPTITASENEICYTNVSHVIANNNFVIQGADGGMDYVGRLIERFGNTNIIALSHIDGVYIFKNITQHNVNLVSRDAVVISSTDLNLDWRQTVLEKATIEGTDVMLIGAKKMHNDDGAVIVIKNLEALSGAFDLANSASDQFFMIYNNNSCGWIVDNIGASLSILKGQTTDAIIIGHASYDANSNRTVHVSIFANPTLSLFANKSIDICHADKHLFTTESGIIQGTFTALASVDKYLVIGGEVLNITGSYGGGIVGIQNILSYTGDINLEHILDIGGPSGFILKGQEQLSEMIGSDISISMWSGRPLTIIGSGVNYAGNVYVLSDFLNSTNIITTNQIGSALAPGFVIKVPQAVYAGSFVASGRFNNKDAIIIGSPYMSTEFMKSGAVSVLLNPVPKNGTINPFLDKPSGDSEIYNIYGDQENQSLGRNVKFGILNKSAVSFSGSSDTWIITDLEC